MTLSKMSLQETKVIQIAVLVTALNTCPVPNEPKRRNSCMGDTQSNASRKRFMKTGESLEAEAFFITVKLQDNLH